MLMGSNFSFANITFYDFTKVGICVANDAMKIWRGYNISIEPLEDLSVFANLKLGGAPKKWSLGSLTETLTCKEVQSTT